MRVVLDTNILVSGLITSTAPPAQILNALRDGRLVAVMSEATLAELAAVLQRPPSNAISPDRASSDEIPR